MKDQCGKSLWTSGVENNYGQAVWKIIMKNSGENSSDIPLYLFAKTPQAGKVKTRMQPQLSATEAAKLAEMMLEQCMEKVARNWRGKKVLAVTPSADHPLLIKLCKQYQFTTWRQIGGDLGMRMSNALNLNFNLGHNLHADNPNADNANKAGGAVVMGCDVPHFPHAILSQCHAYLTAGHHVVGAAVDGGFYLLGLATNEAHGTHGERLADQLFAGLDWGEGTVLAGLLKNAHNHGVHLKRLPELNDVDDYHDLKRLAHSEKRYQCFL